MKISELKFSPVSIINADGKQRVVISAHTDSARHYFLSISDADTGRSILSKQRIGLHGGDGSILLWLDPPENDFTARVTLTYTDGSPAAQLCTEWKKPREWTIYVMVSSHTDIGLHNSPYIQRRNNARFVDMASKLCDETGDRDEKSRYRYVMERTWF